MEDDIVIFALGGQRLDLGDVLRRNFRHELDDDRAVLQLNGEKIVLGCESRGDKCGQRKGAGNGEAKQFHAKLPYLLKIGAGISARISVCAFR